MPPTPLPGPVHLAVHVVSHFVAVANPCSEHLSCHSCSLLPVRALLSIQLKKLQLGRNIFRLWRTTGAAGPENLRATAVQATPTPSCVFREYFQPDRSTNPTRLFICAGLGRTGTRTLTTVFEQERISAHHASGVVAHLLPAAFPQETNTSVHDNFVALMPFDAPPCALLDIPTGVLVWDLLDAYPNSTISLTVRKVNNLATLLCLQPHIIGRSSTRSWASSTVFRVLCQSRLMVHGPETFSLIRIV